LFGTKVSNYGATVKNLICIISFAFLVQKAKFEESFFYGIAG
jgi:hypothetical protein